MNAQTAYNLKVLIAKLEAQNAKTLDLLEKKQIDYETNIVHIATLKGLLPPELQDEQPPEQQGNLFATSAPLSDK